MKRFFFLIIPVLLFSACGRRKPSPEEQTEALRADSIARIEAMAAAIEKARLDSLRLDSLRLDSIAKAEEAARIESELSKYEESARKCGELYRKLVGEGINPYGEQAFYDVLQQALSQEGRLNGMSQRLSPYQLQRYEHASRTLKESLNR